MGNKLYVGNLPYSVRDADLEQAFAEFGSVTSAKVMMERDTGRSKGFGFVEMGSDDEAQAAMPQRPRADGRLGARAGLIKAAQRSAGSEPSSPGVRNSCFHSCPRLSSKRWQPFLFKVGATNVHPQTTQAIG